MTDKKQPPFLTLIGKPNTGTESLDNSKKFSPEFKAALDANQKVLLEWLDTTRQEVLEMKCTSIVAIVLKPELDYDGISHKRISYETVRSGFIHVQTIMSAIELGIKPDLISLYQSHQLQSTDK